MRRNDLPENCFATLPSTGELVILKRGETGYHRSDWDTGNQAKNQEIADYHNCKRGINSAQVQAMQIGSMCGFDVPGANPQIYFNRAKFIRTYQIDLSSSIKHPIMAIFSPVARKLHQYQVAGKDAFYLEPANMPKDMMGVMSDFTVLMDMVHGKPLIPVTVESSVYRKWSMSVASGAAAFRKEINDDYQIIAKVQVGPAEYALGELDGKFPSYATWGWTPRREGGSQKHYFDSRDRAIEDFCGRASEKYVMLTDERKPSIKAQLAVKPVPRDKSVQKSREEAR